MEWIIFSVIFGGGWFVRAAGVTGAVNIERCGTGMFVDIVENAKTNITCSGLSDTASVTWSMIREGSLIQDIATCTSSTCTLLQPDQFEVQGSPGQILLVYRQENRTADENAEVKCTSTDPDEIAEAICTFHVISPAVLSGCVVEEDRDNGTVNGSCHFEHAYSARKDFTCIWYQTTTDPDQTGMTYTGIILNKEEYSINGQMYERGQCILSIPGQRWDEANYTYSIDFYPGSGPVPVPIGSQGTSPRPGSPGSPSGSGKAYVIGGVVAALVAAGVVLVVIIVVLKRKKSRGARRHMASDQQPGPTRSTEQISQVSARDYLTPIPYNPEDRGAGQHMARSSEDRPEAVRQMNLVDSQGYSIVPAAALQEREPARSAGFYVSADQPEAVRQMNVEDSEGYSVVQADMLQEGRIKLYLTRKRTREPQRSTEQLGGRDSDGYEVPLGRRV